MNTIISLDLDGTLLDDNKSLDETNLVYIKELMKQKFKVIINTGRSYNSASSFFKNKVNIDIISNNGNICRNTSNDEIIFINPIDKAKALDIISKCNNKNIYPLLHVDMYSEGKDIAVVKKNVKENVSKYIEVFGNRAHFISDFSYLESPILSIIFAGDYEDLLEYKIKFEKLFDDMNIHLMEVKNRKVYILEILNKTGDKWWGIKRYLESKKFPNCKIIAIGDDSNDLKVIENSDIGIAMINAQDFIKKKSNLITKKDNNNLGAIRALDYILKIGGINEY
ncbi:MAG: HAD-IIB family hydrolase [Peptoniphilaceae bacterium]